MSNHHTRRRIDPHWFTLEPIGGHFLSWDLITAVVIRDRKGDNVSTSLGRELNEWRREEGDEEEEAEEERRIRFFVYYAVRRDSFAFAFIIAEMDSSAFGHRSIFAACVETRETLCFRTILIIWNDRPIADWQWWHSTLWLEHFLCKMLGHSAR